MITHIIQKIELFTALRVQLKLKNLREFLFYSVSGCVVYAICHCYKPYAAVFT